LIPNPNKLQEVAVSFIANGLLFILMGGVLALIGIPIQPCICTVCWQTERHTKLGLSLVVLGVTSISLGGGTILVGDRFKPK
jgi:hypothetical protein